MELIYLFSGEYVGGGGDVKRFHAEWNRFEPVIFACSS